MKAINSTHLNRAAPALAAWLLLVAASAAQQCCDSGCDTPPRQQCTCRHCIEEHVYVPVEKPAPEAGYPEGGYAAPPRAGTMAGPTNGVGIEGFSIEFPRLRIALPTLHLPTMTRYRRNPRMYLDEGVAPYVTDVRNEMSFETGRPEAGVPEAGPPEEPPKPEAGPPEPPQPCRPGCDDPGYCLTTTATTNERVAEASFQQRLQRLEATEQRLEIQMRQLQSSLDRLVQLQLQVTARPTAPVGYVTPVEETPVPQRPVATRARRPAPPYSPPRPLPSIVRLPLPR